MDRCTGCNQTIDTDFISTHVWMDADDNITCTYHIDCCPGKHVSEGECADLFESEDSDD